MAARASGACGGVTAGAGGGVGPLAAALAAFLVTQGIARWSTDWLRQHLHQMLWWARSPLLPPLLRWRGLAWELCHDRLRPGGQHSPGR
eukprot:2277662-Prorocentrum_lima.AAC.1